MRPSSSITRHSRVEERHPSLSQERQLVEDVLRAAADPLTPHVIAVRSGLERSDVTVILQRLRHDGLAVNVGTSGKAVWRWRAKLAAPDLRLHASRRPITNASTTGTYDGAELRPFDKRPGAMDFKQWPSRGLG